MFVVEWVYLASVLEIVIRAIFWVVKMIFLPLLLQSYEFVEIFSAWFVVYVFVNNGNLGCKLQ